MSENEDILRGLGRVEGMVSGMKAEISDLKETMQSHIAEVCSRSRAEIAVGRSERNAIGRTLDDVKADIKAAKGKADAVLVEARRRDAKTAGLAATSGFLGGFAAVFTKMVFWK